MRATVFVFATAVLMAMFVPAAHAANYCVSTSAELQQALTASSDGGVHAGETNTIGVVTGIYFIGAATNNDAFYFAATQSTRELTIAGGFSPGCTSRTLNASLTIIDGANQSAAMKLYSEQGPITVGYVTFTLGNGSSPGAGLQVNATTCTNCLAAVTIEHDIFQYNYSDTSCGGLYAFGNPVIVRDNLIANNSSGNDVGGACVTALDGDAEIYGNTVSGNVTAAGATKTGGLVCADNEVAPNACLIYGNVFWNNTNFGLYLASTGAYLLFNDFGLRGGQAPMSEANDLDVAPHFVDSANGDFHLAGDSPLLGMSGILLPGHDLDGHVYPSTGQQDIGAYEETVFLNGFDVQP
jgi:hypothetical protein